MLSEFTSVYRNDLVNHVIPFWEKYSPDREYGGYFTCLDADGSIYDDKKYMWLQAREVWMFARLYNDLEANPDYMELAKLGMDFIEKYGKDEKGRVYFSLTRQGEPFFFQRKPYAAVFYMLALLEYAKASQLPEYFEKAETLFWQIVKWIEDPSLLDRPHYPGRIAASGLADVMVVASMAVELAEIEKKPEYIEIMKKTLAGIKLHFNTEKEIFIENAPLVGTCDHNWPELRLFNPGHSIEVAWFVLKILDFVKDAEAEQLAYRVLYGSLEMGWDREYEGLYYFMDLAGQPTLQLESSMKLWWPHTEAIYALVLAYQKTKDPRSLQWLRKVHDYTYAHFVDQERGGWFGYCDRIGNLTHTCKGGNYMGFFHVPRALLFASKI